MQNGLEKQTENARQEAREMFAEDKAEALAAWQSWRAALADGRLGRIDKERAEAACEQWAQLFERSEP